MWSERLKIWGAREKKWGAKENVELGSEKSSRLVRKENEKPKKK